jgi:hypothetical protein
MPLKVNAGGGYAHVHYGMGGIRSLNNGIDGTRRQNRWRGRRGRIAAGGESGVRIAAGRVSNLEEAVAMLKVCNCRRKSPHRS